MYFILSVADVNLGFTVANIRLPINKVFIAYDDVNYKDLFHREISVNYTYLYNAYCYFTTKNQLV